MVDLIHISQTQYLDNKEYFFFVYPHVTLTTGYSLGHQGNLKIF